MDQGAAVKADRAGHDRNLKTNGAVRAGNRRDTWEQVLHNLSPTVGTIAVQLFSHWASLTCDSTVY